MMHPIQQQAFDQAIAQARQAMAEQQWSAAMMQLKRAHVLGQLAVLPHVYSHWLMLLVAWRRRQWGAVVGQFIRILLGALGSALGKVPAGNTGDSDMSMFQTLPVAPELQQLIDGNSADGTQGPVNSGTNPGATPEICQGTNPAANDAQPASSHNHHKDSSA